MEKFLTESPPPNLLTGVGDWSAPPSQSADWKKGSPQNRIPVRRLDIPAGATLQMWHYVKLTAGYAKISVLN